MKCLNSSIYDRALELIQNRSVKLTISKIEEDTKIPRGWISMFAQGRITNPGIRQVQTLYEYLSKTKIEV